MPDDRLEYVVGEEPRLRELLSENEVAPLLAALLGGSRTGAALLDAGGELLWGAGERSGETLARETLWLEGEPVARLVLTGAGAPAEETGAMARLAGAALNAVLKNNLKRALTTEIHTSVVQSSYQELAARNRTLAESEGRYRELAATLEVRVQERTKELDRAYAHILQQEKMAAVGGLAAGVAHEINTPLGFIISNLHTLQKYASRLAACLTFYRDHPSCGGAGAVEEEARKKWQELKISRVLEDLPELLSESLSGAERVSRIVADLKGFSHVDDAPEMPVDLNEELERTLSVLAHQISASGCRVVRELSPLPPLTCRPQLPDQIFLNILQNALATGAPQLTVTLKSACDGERIAVTIADNGPGVPEGLRERIFEPFFTTREVGSGTGMGLAVVYQAVRRLKGSVSVGDAPGGGAAFTVTVPLGEG